MSTIPDDFEVKASNSNYVKLTAGKHRLRILGPSIAGYEWWIDTPEGGRRPSRAKIGTSVPAAFADTVKQFLAMPVWNYDANKIQIFSITQTSIQKELKALDRDKDWGDLQDYDIEIERTGSEKLTRYRLTPKPKSELSKEILDTVKEHSLPVMEALFSNADPFNYNPEATLSLDEEEKVISKDLPF